MNLILVFNYQKEDWGYELIYLNNTTGVKITYEFREAYIFIMLIKLVDGSLIENPRSIQENNVLYGYGLDDVIGLRNPQALIKPAYQYGEESEYYDKKKGLTLYVTGAKYSKSIYHGNKDLLLYS
ncbi:MAG: hypothetical protein IPL46_16510 [Saprospiraceae bacterium]|nr:hypothetical protein [Saprospiraceae bacterium]